MKQIIACFIYLCLPTIGLADQSVDSAKHPRHWNQWRGPTREGQVVAPPWPESLGAFRT